MQPPCGRCYPRMGWGGARGRGLGQHLLLCAENPAKLRTPRWYYEEQVSGAKSMHAVSTCFPPMIGAISLHGSREKHAGREKVESKAC